MWGLEEEYTATHMHTAIAQNVFVEVMHCSGWEPQKKAEERKKISADWEAFPTPAITEFTYKTI